MREPPLTTLLLDQEAMDALENVVDAADAVAESLEDMKYETNLDDDIDLICEVADFDRAAIREDRHRRNGR